MHRAMDCYRFALSLQSDPSPVLYVNLAILLDQMNFIDDAILVCLCSCYILLKIVFRFSI